MSSEHDHIARLYLFVAAGSLAAATGYIYLRFGLSLGVGILAILTVTAFWGLVSASSRIRRAIAELFSSGL